MAVKENKKYPFTKEELEDTIEKLWNENKDDIDYQAIADFYKRNGWQWGGYCEPRFVPEYRDIKSHIVRTYRELGLAFIDMYFKQGKKIDYENDKVSISGGRLTATMSWDTVDDKHFPRLDVSIDFELFSITDDGYCNLETDDDDDE